MAKFSVQTTTVPREEFKGGKFPAFVHEPYVFTQAGGQPYALTTTIEFNNEPRGKGQVPMGGDPKDVIVNLPPGLLGNPMATPRCALLGFIREGACPPSTQVGTIEVACCGDTVAIRPIYNLVPEMGQSAEFGVHATGGFNFLLTGHLVHSVAGYGFTVVSNNIPMQEDTRFAVTFWGVPVDPSHDPERGLRCTTIEASVNPPDCEGESAQSLNHPGGEEAGVAEVPFLVWPTDCTAGPPTLNVEVDTWEKPGNYVKTAPTALPQPTGCDALSFDPSLEVLPDTTRADEPIGLGVKLDVPQFEEPNVRRTPDLRDAVVTLPPGLSINPGVVDGVQACNESGPEGINFEGSESERTGPDGEPQLAPGKCPAASIVGTAEAVTPLLPEPVKGHLYLARPLCGGTGQAACTEEDARDGRLYRLYLELGGKGPLANAGIDIKAAGVVSANLATGQLTSTFSNNPQTPFSQLKLHLNGGPRAPLANPQACGEARTTSDFTPWSAPGTTPEGLLVTGTPDANPFTFYDVTGCAASTLLDPGFIAGAVIPEAGAFSPFTLTLTRKDLEQDLAGVQLHTPPGLLGMLANVPLCGEPQAAQGSCPNASRIGSTRVASGAGSHPFEIGGDVYLTTGYRGAPFGLSIVTRAVAGPFNLGLVVVRARIDVDPKTSALTVTSDPLPQIVFGVPLRLQRVTVSIDRPDFMFNPTNCTGQQVVAAVSGNQNAVARVASRFAIGGCKALAFKPKFVVSTNGRTSRVNGASLDARVSYPPFKAGSEANIAKVKVSLPRQLPSRLSTLQKACPALTFETDPAACPRASVVGIVRSSTPLLPVGLTGPAYFVSFGGEAFPQLIVVLQGDGVRVDLVGNTFINKGITSSTFKTVPDVPVNSFELYLPQGRFSALAANGDLCSATKTVTREEMVRRKVHGRTVQKTITVRRRVSSLAMPTEFVAQNGLVIHRSTKIAVSGCGGSKGAGVRRRRQEGRAAHIAHTTSDQVNTNKAGR